MKLSYKLEEMFPTEESRFDAYKKWIIISVVLGLSILANIGLDGITTHFERINDISFFEKLFRGAYINTEIWLFSWNNFSVVGWLFTLLSYCISLYIYWKTNVIKTVLKMILGVLIGSFIMNLLLSFFSLLFLLVPIICLLMNWTRLKKFMKRNQRFVKDNFKLLGIMTVAVSSMVIFIFFRSMPMLIAFVFTYFIIIPVLIIRIFSRERNLGSTFFKAYNRLNITWIFLSFSLFSLTASISHSLFNGDEIVNDLMKGDFTDPTTAGTERVFMMSSEKMKKNTMTLSYKLEEIFPTEESRFDAYKKLVIISAICSPVMLIVRAVLKDLIRYIERTGTVTSNMSTAINIFSFLAFLGILFGILSFFVVGYIYWKAKIIHAILKKILYIIIGFFFSYLFINVFIVYLLPRGLSIFGPIVSNLITPIVMILIIIICLIVKRTIIRQYMEKYRDFVIDNLIIIATPFFCIGMVLFGAIISIISSDRSFNSTPVFVMLILAVIVYYAVPPICIVKMLNREKHRGNTFYNAMLQFTMAGFFILTLAFWGVKANDQLFFGDHDIGLDSSDAFDSSTIDSNDFTTDAPGMSTGFNPDMNQANSDSNPFMYDDIHNPDMNHNNVGGDPFMHNTDMGHSASFSNNAFEGIDNTEPNMNTHIDGTFAHSGPDLMEGNFMHIYGGTNMADIPNIQHHPYMIFNDPSAHGNFQVCDPNGMPQMTITNGNIMDSENTVIGHVNSDAVSGTTTYTDINNNPLLSVDSHRQMFSGDHYIGHINTSDNVTVIRDMHEKIIARYDKLTHTWFDQMSKPISRIKPM